MSIGHATFSLLFSALSNPNAESTGLVEVTRLIRIEQV